MLSAYLMRLHISFVHIVALYIFAEWICMHSQITILKSLRSEVALTQLRDTSHDVLRWSVKGYGILDKKMMVLNYPGLANYERISLKKV